MDDVPVAVDDTATVLEDSGLTNIVVVDDDGFGGDGPSTTIDLAIISTTAGGTATLNDGGTPGDPTDDTIDFTPDADFFGTVTVVYEICDLDGDCDTADLVVTVDPVDDFPVAVDDTATVLEDSGLTNIVVVDDDGFGGDGPSTTIDLAIISTTAGGTATLNDGGTPGDPTDDTIDFTPDADFFGTVTVVYEICDLDGDCDTADLVVTVNPVADVPVAVDDAASVLEDSGLTNIVVVDDDDFGTDGPSTTIDLTVVSVTAGGTAVLNDGGTAGDPTDDTIDFTPDVDFFGTVTVVYEICDLDGDCDQANLVVTVSSVNDLPTAVDDTATVLEDSALTNIVVVDDDDFGGDGPSTTTDLAIISTTAGGTAVLNDGGTPGDPTDDTIDFTPDADFFGTVTVVYEICDVDGDCDQANLVMTVSSVNDLPTATDDAAAVLEDSGLTNIVVVDDDSFGGDGPSTTADLAIISTTAGGTATSNDGGTPGDPTDDSIDFTPDADFFGTVTVVYEICDVDGDCDQANLVVTVDPVDEFPTAVDDTASVVEDSGLTNVVVVDDDDFGGDGPSTTTDLAVISTTAGGTAVLNDGGTAGDPTDDSIDFTPDADFFGTVTVVYEICDLDGDCDQANLVLTVTNVNDAPVAQPDADSTNAEAVVTVDPLVDNGSGADTDADSIDMLIVTAIDTTGTIGLVTLNPDGTVSYDPNGQYASLPAGATATDTFTYTVCDDAAVPLCDTATVTITITGVGDEPLAFDDTETTPEDTAVTVDVASNDTDPDGDLDPTSPATDTAPANGSVVFNGDGTVTYTPDPDFFGVDSFTYVIFDDTGLSDIATVTITVTAVEDAPAALDDLAVTDEDVPVIVTVLANDSDAEGNLDPSSVVVGDGVNGLLEPVNGAVVANPDGTVTYTPDPDFFGTDIFEYEVCDTLGNCSTASVSVTVNSLNDQPVAIDDSDTTLEDTPATIDVQFNDSDPDGDPLTTTLVSAPTNGTVAVNPDGTATYTPDPNFSGVDSFTYEVCDLGLPILCDQATVSLTVSAVNDAPVANGDANTTDEDLPVTTNLVTNDSDTEDVTVDPTSVVIVTGPTNGTITAVNPDGTVEYTPDADFFGTDTFTYTVLDSDGLISNVGTVTITVNSVNDGPTAQDDVVSTNEDTPATFDPLADNGNGPDSDPDLDTLTVSAVTQGSNGTATLNGDGTITYTPDPDFNGTDAFTYTVCDLGLPVLCDTATVTVTIDPINDAPVAQDDADSTEEGFAVTTNVGSNDSDPEGLLDLGSITITTPPTNGTITAINPDGSVEYTPGPGFTGTDTYVYSICDTVGVCDTALVTITVTDNTPPVPADDAVGTSEDVPVTFDPLADNGGGADTDPDGDPLTVASVTQPANGTVVLNADGTITYTPDADFNGTDTFTYTVCDDGIPAECATATVTVTVAAVNDVPVAGNDLATTDEDVAVTVAVTANDSDVEDGTVDPTSVTITSAPSNGTITAINADGSVEYTPDADFSGTDTFEYQVCDLDGACDTATVTVTVNAINDTPTAADDPVGTSEDVPVTFDPLADNGGGADTDPDGDPLTVASVTQPANGTVVLNADGTITYTPDADFNGTDTFTYLVCDPDGACDTATVTVTVAAVNDVPVAGDDLATTDEDVAVTVAVTANDSDVENGTVDPTSVTITSAPSNGTITAINADGSVEYTPDADFSGTDTFEYQVCDLDGACDTATVTVTVNAINDTPTAADDPVGTSEDVPVTFDPLADNGGGADTDPDGDPLTVASVTQPANGTVVLNADGTITYTPDADFNGTDTFTYLVCDPDGACDTATVTVTVGSVNDAPIVINESPMTDEDTPINLDLIANDSDPDGDAITLDSVDAVSTSGGTVVVELDGTVTYTPPPNFSGTDTFAYTVCDPFGACTSGLVEVDVLPVNDPPVGATDTVTVDEDVTTTLDVLANDSDVDGDVLSVTGVDTTGTLGTVVVNPDGTIDYTPPAGYNGPDSFTYTVCDPAGLCDVVTVNLTVAALPDPPVATDDTAVTSEDTVAVIDVLVNDSDADGDPLTVNLITQPANGTVSINADDTITYIPDPEFSGTDTFTYTVCDGTGRCDIGTVTVTVDPVNDAPVAADDFANADVSGPTVIDVLANDSDVDGDPLVIDSVTQPANGTVTINPDGTITYVPDAGFSGDDTFTYTICDAAGECSTATVTVTAAILGSLTGQVWFDLNYDGVIDAGEVDISGVRLVLDYAGPDGVFGTPDDQLGIAEAFTASPYLFTDLVPGNYRVTVDVSTLPPDFYWTYDLDGSFDSMAVATVFAGEVTPLVDFGYVPGNVPPVAVDDAIIVTLEDTSVTIQVIANDSDPNGQQLEVASVTQPANGSVTVNNDGTVTYVPDAEYNGADSFTYTICETTETPIVGDPEGLCATATVILDVTYVNDAPVIGSTIINAVVGGTIPALPITDIEGDPFVVSLSGGTLPPGVTTNPDGSFNGSPSAPGSFTFVIEVCDDAGVCQTIVVTMIVRPGTLPFEDDTAAPATLPYTGHNAGADMFYALLLMLAGFALLMFTRERFVPADPTWAPTPLGSRKASRLGQSPSMGPDRRA